MAGGSSSSGTAAPIVLQPIAEKLSKNNHVTWRAQVGATLRGARLEGYVNGKKPAPAAEIKEKQGDKTVEVSNPEYEDWLAVDQQVLSFILNSVTKEILVRLARKKTAAEAWVALEEQFATQTRARAVTICMALANTKKGNISVTEYIAKMQSLGHEMASAGKPLDDEDLVQYILAGVDEDFDSVVNSVLARVEPITVSELTAQMLSFESRVALRSTDSPTSANFARRGRGGFGRGYGRGRENRGGRSPTPGRRPPPRQGGRGTNSDRPQCQVCLKYGHTAKACWYRYEEDYEPEQKQAAAATTSSYNIDPNWYNDTGATDHITGELDKLTTREKYNGGEKVHTANGTGSGHEENPA